MPQRYFSEQAMAFNQRLAALTPSALPPLLTGYRFMNPFANGVALEISGEFYHKYYHDSRPRKMILGINPGRHGAGRTGVPFTDSKRLEEVLEIDPKGLQTHEPSAVFVYKLIALWGGATSFYDSFYINSPLPLGLLRINQRGRPVNCNYYDSKPLQERTLPFIMQSMNSYLEMAIQREVAWVWGKGKNYLFLARLNSQYHWFKRLIPLPHPRYVVQYKSKETDSYLWQCRKSLQGV